jgi:putative chitinase
MLATTKHETADTFQPIHEYGSHAYFVRRYGSQTKIGKQLGNDTAEEGAIYAGRGDVQLTGETNYEKAEDALRSDYPDLVAQYEARTGKNFRLDRR